MTIGSDGSNITRSAILPKPTSLRREFAARKREDLRRSDNALCTVERSAIVQICSPKRRFLCSSVLLRG
jgi:hypothetical protein